MNKYSVCLDGKALTVYPARVSKAPINKVWDGVQRSIEQTEDAYFVSFDLCGSGKLEIAVDSDFETFEVRPLSVDFKAERAGRKITLSVERPGQFTVEIDGPHHALHVFANTAATKPSGDVIYYGKGEHKADLIWLESNQTLYIDEGAVVYGVIYAKDAENVRIMGRGILDSSPYRRGNDDTAGGREVIDALLEKGFTPLDMKYHGNLVLNHCKNCTVEGIILRDAPMWCMIVRNDCENITIDNIKIVGQWRYNADGINICTSKYVTVKNSFIRSFDDGIITRGAYLEGESGNVENVLVENCVLWCDWGKSFESWCGHKPTEIRNVTFKDCFLIHLNAVAMNVSVWYGSEHSVVDTVRYENIFIDLDEEYYYNQLETPEKPVFEEKPGHVPCVLSVSVERLGKMVDLGSQKCEAIDDFSDFRICFRNISYRNIRYFGSKRSLRTVIRKHSDIHVLENITAEDCDFQIEGWENNGIVC